MAAMAAVIVVVVAGWAVDDGADGIEPFKGALG